MNTQSVNTSLYQKGDISLERIYGKYRNSFIRYAGKVLSDEFYAEDVVQDVFTGLFQQTNYFVSEMAALKCIYIAIYNRSIDMLCSIMKLHIVIKKGKKSVLVNIMSCLLKNFL